jgi:ABC-type transport system involved in multi-copper enzyme maturation permease subunit
MSPIHDQSYRRYQGSRNAVGRAWSVIAWAGIRSMLAKRVYLGLVVLSWVPFIVNAVRIYAATNFPQAGAFFGVNPDMFRSFLDSQGVFVFFMTVWAGAGLIANDRRVNALQIYLSKPLLRSEYIGGKFAVLAAFLLNVTLVPGLLLILLQIAFSGSFDFIGKNAYLIPAVILGSLVQVIMASTTMLALSSLSKSSRYAALLYTGAIFFTDALFNALRLISGSTRMSWLSITANMAQVTDVIFRKTPKYETPWIVSLMVLLALIAVSISVLERRVRGVEVVS